MKKKLLMVGAAILGLAAISCDRGGTITDPETVNLTNGFAKFVENTDVNVARYYVALTTGTGTSVDDITGPGDILLLEILTENTSGEDSGISPGTYTLSGTSTAAGTVVLSTRSQFGKVGSSGDTDLKLINGGSMTVSESGGVYTISGTFTEPAGEEFVFNYTGAITFPAKPISMTTIEVLYIGLERWTNHNHYIVVLTDEDSKMVSLYLDGLKTYFYDGINPDTYVYSETPSGSTFTQSKLMKSEDSYLILDGKMHPITGGQVEISKEGENFIITGEVEGQADTMKFRYSGPIPMKRARLNLNYASGLYYGNHFYAEDVDGEELGHENVGMYTISLSNLEGSWGLWFSGPGENLNFVLGGDYADNGTLDPVNYMQEFIPAGAYVYDEGTEEGSYDKNLIWGGFTGDFWNDINFIAGDSALSGDKMTDSSIEVAVGASTPTGYMHTITGTVTTDNGVEIEFTFEGPIKFEKGGSTIRPRSTLISDHEMPVITQAYFADWGEADDGVYEGELYLGTANSDPLSFEPETGEFIILSMFRPNESPLLPSGTNHFTIGRYDEYLPMTINRPLQDEIWESSWLIGDDWDISVPIFGIEYFDIKQTGPRFAIDYIFLDDALPPNRISGFYEGIIYDYWDEETPISAPARNYVERLPEAKKARQAERTDTRKAAKL